MRDADKTKDQLIDELEGLRHRVVELEGIEFQGEALERLVLGAPIGCFIIKNGKFMLVNPEFQEITGYREDELLGGDCFSLVAPELRRRVRENTIQMLKGKTSIPFEFKFIPKSGEAKWCLQKVISIQYEGDRALLGYFMDITEKKRAEEALRRAYDDLEVKVQERTVELLAANRTLDAVIQASPEPILAIDPEGKIQLWNPAAERVFGWQKEEVIGQPNPIVSPENQEEFRVLRERELRGEAFHGLEIQRCKKDGSLIDLSLSSAPIRDAEGRITGIMGILSDITQRKRLEQDLAHSKTLFEAIFNSITDAAIFADTNRRILILNTATKAMFGYDPEEMAGRTTEFLYIDKAAYEEQGRRRYHPGADRSVPVYEIDYRRKDGVVFPAETLGTQVQDPQGNILGFISIIRDISERKLAEAERERLISELRQALAQVKTLKGLLPICAHCKKIRDDEGYWNNVENYIRDRAEVEFSHGICPGCLKKHYPSFKDAEIPLEKEQITEMVRGKGRILVMDDEETVREVVSKLLKKLGYEVTSARDGMEAIDLYKKAKDLDQPFAAAILDLTVLDGLDGKEAMEQLLVFDPKIKAIVSSGHLEEPIMSDFEKYGFSGAIAKPYRIVELSKVLHQVINE